MEDLEHYEYQDEGCDLFPSCLNCPLPRCRYDEPGGRQKGRGLRNLELIRLHTEGKGIKELSDRFGVSKRTIHRIIASAKQEVRYE